MQFSDNNLKDGHLPPEIPRIDGCDSFSSCHNGRSRCRFEVPDATGRTTTYVVVVRGGWLQRERGCMQSGHSTRKTRPCLLWPLWLVTWN